MDEIFELKKQKDVMDRELGQKDSQLFDAKTELDKSATALKNAEIKIQSIRSQVIKKNVRLSLSYNVVHLALIEIRTHNISGDRH
jgi:hypothetical protein